MSSMPERDTPGQWGGSTQQSAGPSERTGTPGHRGAPGQEQFGSVPPSGVPGQPAGEYPGQPSGRYWGSEPYARSPVDRGETNVVGRRVVQYVIDYVLVGIIPGLAYWLFDRGSGILHGFGWTLATLIAIVVYLWTG